MTQEELDHKSAEFRIRRSRHDKETQDRIMDRLSIILARKHSSYKEIAHLFNLGVTTVAALFAGKPKPPTPIGKVSAIAGKADHTVLVYIVPNEQVVEWVRLERKIVESGLHPGSIDKVFLTPEEYSKVLRQSNADVETAVEVEGTLDIATEQLAKYEKEHPVSWRKKRRKG